MKRPVFVTIVGILGIVSGIAQTVFGGGVIALRNDQKLLDEAGIKSGTAVAIGVACIVVGVLGVLFAIGLLRGSRVARGLLGISQLAQIGVSIYALAALDSSRRPAAIAGIVGSLIVLYFLFGTAKAKAFFAKS